MTRFRSRSQRAKRARQYKCQATLPLPSTIVWDDSSPRRNQSVLDKTSTPTSTPTSSSALLIDHTNQRHIPQQDEKTQVANIAHTPIAAEEVKEQVEIEVESTHSTKGIFTKRRLIPNSHIIQIQNLIAAAKHKDKMAQNNAIDKAIALLYPYTPRECQRVALHHPRYHRKDLILIAKTSFGKSMILQAVSLLLHRSYRSAASLRSF